MPLRGSLARLRYHTVWRLARYLMRLPRLWRWARWLWLSADSHGLSWFRNGDEIYWVWPWMRQTNGWKPYYSICTTGSFHSLAAIDDFWNDYNEACVRRWEEENDKDDPIPG